MPYVEGFGTWPFGEEWLWEAMATCYLPLLDLLDAGAPLTLSLTPVLCDQLEASGIAERFVDFLQGTRRYTHTEDIEGMRAGGHDQLARELKRAWGDYEGAVHSFAGRGRDLLGALSAHAQWTSSATHAVLPLLATETGARAQIYTGVNSHRARFGEGWRGGFWLPECAHAPWLEPTLADAGARATCVELTNRFGLGAPEHLRPVTGESGVVLVPVDRATMSLVWSDGGYPAHGVYRDYHRHTIHHHNPWANDGGAYDHDRALVLAREHAADFVSRIRERLERAADETPYGEPLPGGGLVVCALDTELLGHWWYEGLDWLSAVVDECSRQGLPLVRLDDALDRVEPAHLSDLDDWEPSTWGQNGDLSTWSGPAATDLAFASRAGELKATARRGSCGQAAIRELLALQASDWAFMVSRGLAVPYALERAEGHRTRLQRALADGPEADATAVRNLAIHADSAALLAP
jgi:1,4-alpha-glucan branching enzyme